MFTTVERVKALTNYDVTLETIAMAQGIIESYVGRLEIEVENPSDRLLLEKAVSYQAAYMKDGYEMVFEQASVIQTYASDGGATFNTNKDSPVIAPLAEIACRRLSWRGTRSIAIGSLYGSEPTRDGWAYN